MRIWESALAKEMVLEADGLEQEFAQRKRVGIEHRTFFNHKTAIEEMLGIEIKNDRAIILHEQPFPGEF